MTWMSAAALMALSAPAFANTTSVACGDYVIVLADDVAIQGEALAGSRQEFESTVCDRSSEASSLDNIKTIPVFIDSLGISSRITIVPLDDD